MASESREEIMPQSRRACNDPIGNGPYRPPLDGKGCGWCDNQDRYGYGKSVCGRCNRCHGCGSTNNGIGPIQSVWFGGKWVVRKVGEAIGGGGGGGGGQKGTGGSEGQSVEAAKSAAGEEAGDHGATKGDERK